MVSPHQCIDWWLFLSLHHWCWYQFRTCNKCNMSMAPTVFSHACNVIQTINTGDLDVFWKMTYLILFMLQFPEIIIYLYVNARLYCFKILTTSSFIKNHYAFNIFNMYSCILYDLCKVHAFDCLIKTYICYMWCICICHIFIIAPWLQHILLIVISRGSVFTYLS